MSPPTAEEMELAKALTLAMAEHLCVYGYAHRPLYALLQREPPPYVDSPPIWPSQTLRLLSTAHAEDVAACVKMYPPHRRNSLLRDPELAKQLKASLDSTPTTPIRIVDVIYDEAHLYQLPGKA